MLPVSFGVETVVVKVGADGALVKELSSLGYSECENIVVIIDPRRPRRSAYGEIMAAFDGDDSKMSRVKLALLMPSTSSSKEALLMAEFALHNLALSVDYPATAQRLFIRMDDYLVHGDGIISAMIAEEKTVYPADEQANMLAMLKQFPASVYNYRALCHFYVGDGGEEGEIVDFVIDDAGAAALLGKEDAGLASLGPVPKNELLSTGAMFAQSAPSLFLAFNEDTASTMRGALGADVKVCTPCNKPWEDEVPPMNEASGLAFKDLEMDPSVMLLASRASAGYCGCMKKLPAPAKMVHQDEDYDSGEMVDQAECCMRECEDTEIKPTGLGDDAVEFSKCDDCGHVVCKSCFKDIAEGADFEAASKEMIDETPTPISIFNGKDCIMLIDADKDLADVPLPTGYQGYSSYPGAFFTKFREAVCDKPLVSIVMADSYESLVANRRVSTFIPLAVENCDIVLFCLKSDTEHVKAFCTGAKFSNESVMDSFIRCSVPFPRLHFFTFANNMGRELPDGSILGPSFTISADSDGANNIAASKYLSNVPNPQGKTTPLFTFTNAEGQSATDRVLPGAPGITTTTIINNATFIQDLCKALLGEDPKDEDGEPQEGQSLKTFLREAGFNEDYIEFADEIFGNTRDLAGEYSQYAGVVTALPDEDEDEDEE
jgi:hypothetical protein